MGDRGNIVIKQTHLEQEDIQYLYFYTHSNGSDIPNVLQAALRRGRERWDDEQYLARIIFCEMIKDDVMDTSYYGISTYIGDNGNDLLVVDSNKQTVSRVSGDDPNKKPKDTWSFEQFVALKIDKEFGYDED